MKTSFAALAALMISITIPVAAQSSGPTSHTPLLSPTGDPVLTKSLGDAVTQRDAKFDAPKDDSTVHSSQASGVRQGIQVSGQWVIEVKGPDGKVKTRREAENAIQPSGMSFLAAIIAGNSSSGGIDVSLSNDFASQTGPCSSNGNASPCRFALGPNQQGQTSRLAGNCPNTACSDNLTVTAPTASQVNGEVTQIVLSGSIVASSPTSSFITYAATGFLACDPNSSPYACKYVVTGSEPTRYSGNIFTALTFDGLKGDPAPVSYAPGDTINVTVTLSFSSPSPSLNSSNIVSK